MTPIMAASLSVAENQLVETALRAQPTVRLRPIALPAEHGGWGILGAPILAGLLVAPSTAGLLIGFAALGGFLTRQPLRLALTDLRKGKRYPRTAWALRFSALYSTPALLLLAFALASTRTFLFPLALAAALGAIQFSYDFAGKGRKFLPEATGAAALSLVATAIALAGGLAAGRAWLLAPVLALQAATAISYAAARVRIARGVEVQRKLIWIGHVLGLALIGLGAITGLLRWPILAAFAALTLRVAWGLSARAKAGPASLVGLQEVGYALLTVIALVISV